MSKLIVTLFASLLAFAVTHAAHAEPIVKPSPFSVDETLDRLETAIEGAGAKVFARVDHAAGAAAIGEDLKPASVLIFGNPKIGTPAMQADPRAGLDLPLRVLAYEDASGQVNLLWHDPADLAQAYGIPADHPVLATMSGAIGKLTDAAVTP